MATKGSILEALAEELPLGLQLGFYYISSPPIISSPLFSAAPGCPEEATFCESHFLAVSVTEKEALQRELLVFAIEVLVFTTQNLTTVFVSKADSAGYLHLLKAQLGTPSIIKTICTTFLSCLVKQRLHGPRVLLSLFARSQNQYLFPGSIENPGKHVLDDRQLIKWWCRALDPILREYGPAARRPQPGDHSSTSSHAYIIVPGCDRFETGTFFPPKAKVELISRWSNYYPQDLVAPDGSAPPRCLIPRFPDDPKARFLDDLDSEISDADRSSSGKWKSMASLDQFWEMMSYRQECSAGRLVGFIWIVFTPPPKTENKQVSTRDSTAEKSDQALRQLPTPNQSQMNSLDPVLPPLPSDEDPLEPIKAVSPPPSSPFLQPMKASHEPTFETHAEDSQQNPQEQQTTQSDPNTEPSDPSNLFYDAAKTIPARWATTTHGQLLLPEPKYQSLMQHLLSSDFSTQDLAAQSTSSWIAKAAELAGKANTTTPSSSSSSSPSKKTWGKTITGLKPVPPPTIITATSTNQQNGTTEPITTTTNNNDTTAPKINILTGIRKKRKLDTTTAASNSNSLTPLYDTATSTTPTAPNNSNQTTATSMPDPAAAAATPRPLPTSTSTSSSTSTTSTVTPDQLQIGSGKKRKA